MSSVQWLQGKVLPCVLAALCQLLWPCFFQPLVVLLHVLSCSSSGSSCLHSPGLEEQSGVETTWNEIVPGKQCLVAESSLSSEQKQLDTHEGVEGDALCQQDSQSQHSHGQHVHSLPFSICSGTRKEHRDQGLGLDGVILAQRGTMPRGQSQGKEEQQRSRAREHGKNRGAQALSLLLLASWGLCATAGATLEQHLVSAECVVFCLLCPGENPFPCLYPPNSNGTSHLCLELTLC